MLLIGSKKNILYSIMQDRRTVCAVACDVKNKRISGKRKKHVSWNTCFRGYDKAGAFLAQPICRKLRYYLNKNSGGYFIFLGAFIIILNASMSFRLVRISYYGLHYLKPPLV